LNIDAPGFSTETKCLKGTVLAEPLGFINMFVASVVSCTWVALGVFILHDTAESLEHRPGGEILRWNEVNEVALAVFLLSVLVSSPVHTEITPTGLNLHVSGYYTSQGHLLRDSNREAEFRF